MSIMRGRVYFWIVLVDFLLLGPYPGVNGDTALLLGGHVNALFSPGTDEVETFSSCGIFDSGIPKLPEPRRSFAVAQLGQDIVLCGGYKLIVGGQKDCLALGLGESPPQWRHFEPLIHARYQHAMLTVGGSLYAVGGSGLAGDVPSIERYDSEKGAWEEVAQTYGTRLDFCAVTWGRDGLLLVGGYDDMGGQQHVELLNTTTMEWSRLAGLNTPRGLHACTVYKGGVMVAGGWTPNYNDPDYPTQDPTKTDEWYDPATDSWTEMTPMRHRRTSFGLAVINGTLTAFGGYEGNYVDTIEYYHEGTTPDSPGGWSFHPDRLQQAKSDFGFVRISDMLEDPNC